MTKSKIFLGSTLILNCFGPSNRGDYELLSNFLEYVDAHTEGKHTYYGIANSVSDCNRYFPDICWLSRFGAEKSENLSRALRLLVSSYFYLWLHISALFKINPGFLCPSVSRLVRLAATASRIYSCPGGYLEDSGIAYILSALYIIHAARWRNPNSRLVLAPMSIGPIKCLFGKFLIAKMLSFCDLVCLRERWSLAFCQHLMKKIEKDKVPEMGLYPDFAAITGLNNFNNSIKLSNSDDYCLSRDFINRSEALGNSVIGITFVDWNFPEYSQTEKFKTVYVESMVYVMDYLLSKGYSLLIINQVSTDLSITDRIIENLKFKTSYDISTRVLVQRGDISVDEIKSLISDVVGILASRFHSALFSLQAGTPVVAIGYLPKSQGILELCNLLRFYENINDVSGRSVVKKLNYAIENKYLFNNAMNTYLENCEDPSHIIRQSVK